MPEDSGDRVRISAKTVLFLGLSFDFRGMNAEKPDNLGNIRKRSLAPATSHPARPGMSALSKNEAQVPESK